jgi:hypothetical protein
VSAPSEPVARVLAAFQGAKKGADGWMAPCPAHDDHTPSLSITERDGRILLKCHAGCSTTAVVAAAGLTMADLFASPTSTGNGQHPHVVAEYPYHDEHGVHLFDVVRFEPKDFRQRAASGVWNMKGVRRVPYRLPQLLDAVKKDRTVFACEGEKDVLALVALGLVATTNAGGAGKWRPEYAEHFRGARVVILPDNDAPGQAHARNVARHLFAVAKDVRIVALPGVAPKGDVSDWLGAGGTVDALKALVSATPILTAPVVAAGVPAPAIAADPFPPIEPWATPVNGAEVLDEVCALVRRYMVLPAHGPEAVALWVLHTYLVDVADYTPYLLVTSPVRECGKSTLLDVLVHIAHRAQQTGGITAAALYRRINRHAPALLLDELDTRLRGDSGELLRGVLNTGFHRSGKITICVGDNHEDKDFATFCPKVLAGIGRVWDTVTSRSIPLRLNRATKGELVALTKIRGDRIGNALLPFRRKLRRFADDNRNMLRIADPVTPEKLSARQGDVWRPLLAIADAALGHWPQTARAAALALHGVAEEEGDYGLLLLQDVHDLFATTGAAVLPSAGIVQKLVQMEERPWPEYRHGQPISTRSVASLLGRFDVKPKMLRLDKDTTARGYARHDLQLVFDTYLGPIPPVLSVTSVTTADVTERGTDVTDGLQGVFLDVKLSVTGGKSADVTDVTDKTGGMGPPVSSALPATLV